MSRKKGIGGGAVLALAAVLTVGLMGCMAVTGAFSSDSDKVSQSLQEAHLPAFGFYLRDVPDFRTLARPSEKLRTTLTDRSVVYRVISAETHSADLAVWSTDLPDAWAAQEATGTGCVRVRRQDGQISSEVIDCPGTLQPEQPEEVYLWGQWPDGRVLWSRDSAAVATSMRLLDSAGQALRELVVAGPDKTSSVRQASGWTAEQVVTAIHTVTLAADQTVEINDLQLTGHGLTALVIAQASATDPTNIDERQTGRACMAIALSSQADGTQFLTDPRPCS